MKCRACNFEGVVADEHSAEGFTELKFRTSRMLDTCLISMRGGEKRFNLFVCPECGTVRAE